jgi:hypothetical protein
MPWPAAPPMAMARSNFPELIHLSYFGLSTNGSLEKISPFLLLRKSEDWVI